MTVELKIPQIGESVSEVTIDKWLKQEGESIERDNIVAVLESEKATVELPADVSGTLSRILKKGGETAQVGEVIAVIETDGQPNPATKAEAHPSRESPRPPSAKAKPPKAEPPRVEKKSEPEPPPVAPPPLPKRETGGTPPAEKLVSPPQTEPPVRRAEAAEDTPVAGDADGREEEVIPMTRLRRTVARRLVEAQHTAALLTTFNEIDMAGVMALRKQFGDAFQQKYDIKLGFMSFFVKAAVDALKVVPQVNAEIRGDNIVFKNYYDIAVAIGSGKGLVVPVVRNAERLSFAEVEIAIADLARRAKDNTLKPDELQGGTFTISNGGIYGSLLSTPIINPPQSGILGMHAIQERPVAREGQVVIRPMMYVALTYDHRLVDGREAVTFLKRIKEVIEDPARMLMEV